MNGIKANAQICVGQVVNLVLKNLILKFVGYPYNEVLLTTDGRFKHYKAIEDRTILKDGLWFQKYYEETGSVK